MAAFQIGISSPFFQCTSPVPRFCWGGGKLNRQRSPPAWSSQISPSTLPSKHQTALFTRRTDAAADGDDDVGPLDNSGENDDIAKETDPEYLSQIREADFFKTEIERVESMEEILEELEGYYFDTVVAGDIEPEKAGLHELENEDGVYGGDEDEGVVLWSEKKLEEILGNLPPIDEDDEAEDGEEFDFVSRKEDELSGSYGDDELGVDDLPNMKMSSSSKQNGTAAAAAAQQRPPSAVFANLEQALLQGVVPVSADVGTDCLPGDFGFDPLNLASKDYFRPAQNFFINLVPEPDTATGGKDNKNLDTTTTKGKPRPRALILRDYREAEIRHGRLAMLAAVFWPFQEMLDQLLLDPDQVGPLIYDPVTLPYFPLIMTFIMLNLGYLDIYSQAIKDRDSIGEAFLPGDCFWDPLRILEGAPDSMKRNMQERELFNGRVAMLAIALFTWEEAITHLPLMEIGSNELLLKPAYEVPFIQEWLDNQFRTFVPPSQEL